MPGVVEDPKKLEGFERVYPLVGGHHRYQWLLLAIAAIAGTNSLHHLGYTFIGAIPDHWCKIQELSDVDWSAEQIKNISIPGHATRVGYDQCSYYDLDYSLLKFRYGSNYEAARASIDFSTVDTKSCSEWNYDTSIYKSTMVTEFNLVCKQRYLTGTIQASYMSGVFVGSLVLGAVSDRVLGRRGCVLFSSSCIMLGGFGAWLSPSYIMFVICRFIIAIGAAGNFQNRLTILMEYCDSSSRAKFSNLLWMPYCFVYMSMALYAYLLRDWRDLQLAFSITTLVMVSYFWIMPESSRWLATKNRDEEAFKILEKIARVNKRPVPDRMELAAILDSCKDKTEVKEEDTAEVSILRRAWTGLRNWGRNYVNLVRTPELRRRSFTVWPLFISVTLVYYGIAFDSPTLSSDPFTIVFLGGLVEIPGYLGAIQLVKWGRKPAVSLMFLVAGFACLAIGLLPHELTWLRITFFMIGKMFITGCFATVYLVATELYPTSERATGVAASALISRVGAILAPYVALTRSVYPNLPTITFAIAALCAGLIALLIPETKDKEMLEQVDQVEEIAARNRSGSQTADGVKSDLEKKESIGLHEVNGAKNA